jgi:hypothetical protein
MIKQKSYSVDFKELPRNGKLFEQFVRELLLILGVHPHWTGQGADHGTDILATEQIIGPMSLVGPVVETHRKWLVQCKHFAHSRRSVGRKDTGSIVDDCRQVGANAYLLVCSTQPSSSLVTKLEEISTKPHNNLVTLIWDSVDLEKMLPQTHGNFSTGKEFLVTGLRTTNPFSYIWVVGLLELNRTSPRVNCL